MTVLWEEKTSIKLHIDTLFICLETKKSKDLEPNEFRKLQLETKRAQLEAWEAQIDASLATAAPVNGPKADDASQSYRAVVDKLELTISNINLCFYDTATCHTFGLRIDVIKFVNRSMDKANPNHVIKTAEISGLSVYIDHSKAPDNPAAAEKQKHEFILLPFTANVCIAYDKPGALPDVSRPRINIVTSIPDLSVQLHREQYLCSAKLVDFWSDQLRRRVVHPDRPLESPLLAPREWWQYVLKHARNEARNRLYRRSPGYLAHRRKMRLRYVELYLKLRAEKLPKKELREMEVLEEEFALQDLIFFRCTAIRRQQAPTGRSAAARHSKSSWSSWFSGTSKKTDLSSEVADEEDLDSGGPMQALTDEERELLFSALSSGPQDASATYTSLVSSECAEQVIFSLHASLEMCNARLIDPSGGLNISASISRSSIALVARPRAAAANLALTSLLVRNEAKGRILCQQIDEGDKRGAGKELLLITLESDRGAAPALTSARVRVAQLEIVFDPYTLQAASKFWDVEEEALELDVASKLSREVSSGVQGGVTRQVKAVASKGERLKLDIDMAAPNVYVFEKTVDKLSTALLVKFGRVVLRDVEEVSRSISEGVWHNQLMLTVERLGVELFKDVNTSTLDLTGLRSFPIVEDTILTTAVDLDLPLTARSHEGLIVNADVPALKTHLSLDELVRITRLAVSWHVAPVVRIRNAKGKGRVLVHGLPGIEGWCWRWVTVYSTELTCYRAESERSSGDASFSLYDYGVSSESFQEKRVIALSPFEEVDGDEKRSIKIYAGTKHSKLLNLLQPLQRAIHPFMDIDTDIKNAMHVFTKPAASSDTVDGQLIEMPYMRFNFTAGVLRMIFEAGESCFWESNLEAISLAVVKTEEIDVSFEVMKVEITDTSSCRKLLGVDVGTGEEGVSKPLDMRYRSTPKMAAEAVVKVAALNLSVDPMRVAMMKEVHDRLMRAAKQQPDGDAVIASSRDDMQSREADDCSVSTSSCAISAFCAFGIQSAEIPNSFLTQLGKRDKVVNTILFDATGLTVHFLDTLKENFCNLDM